jgi:NCS1 family nucleobase:cation symporter-1
MAPPAPEDLAAEPKAEGRNPVFGLESRGFSHIPEAERNMALGAIGPMWLGANINMFSVSVGCMGIGLGLNLWQALGACVIGNLPYAYVGLASIGAVRAGLPVTTFSRSVYGVRANTIHALLTWAASVCFEIFNGVFGALAWLSLMGLLGLDHASGGAKLFAVAIQLTLGGGIAVFGHATMVFLQRYFAVALGALFLLVLAFTLPQAHWGAAASGHAPLAGLALAAAFMTACGVIAAQPVSYLYNGPDWVRYLPSRTPGRSIFHRVFWWTFLPSVVLTGAGAVWASLGDMSDPVAGLKPLVPPWLFALFVISVIAGSVANNAPTFYSSGLSLQAAGLRLNRWSATALDIGVSAGAVLYILFVQDLSTALNDFVALLVAWSGPYAGVWLADGLLRRWRFDLNDIHPPPGPRRRRAETTAAWVSYAAGMALAAATMKSPLYQGPLNRLLGGMDLSWLLGLVVAGAAYAGLSRLMRPATEGGSGESGGARRAIRPRTSPAPSRSGP